MNKTRGLLAAVVGLVVLLLGGTWLYINVIKDDPESELTLDDLSPTETAPESETPKAAEAPPIDGTWAATSNSEVGYRVTEVLFGQEAEGVGRTNDVTGSMTIVGTTIETATFEVQMATITSDSGQRDGQFRGRIMATDEFPTATFTLTSPIDLGEEPAVDTDIEATAIGDLTLKGETRQVELKITARRSGVTISALAKYTIAFADWGISNPSAGPAQVGDEGILEIGLVFEK